ncbi:FkbM family methyltransferase [Roseibium sp.]|uniref:FkbM family methyltransferase n=1 Tax=Roseibium sp. TaxID=1936156 RepID=UPI003D1445A8
MSMLGNPISVDWKSGAASGASLIERAGLGAMSAAARALAPLDSLGFSHAAMILRKLLPSRRPVCLVLDQDALFTFPYGDAYWSRLLRAGGLYEEEIENLLLALKDVDYVFIDCGANYGYWSVKVTSERFGGKPAVAVELDPDSFAQLQTNAAVNNGRFACMNRAVYDRDGEVLDVYGAKHEARSVAADETSAISVARVESVTLGRIVAEAGFGAEQFIVLKLDVEGVEIKVLQGANDLLEKDLLIIYEEHGNDPDHTVSAFLVKECGMRLFGHDGDSFFELGAVSDLNGLKTNRRKGYDFFATRSRFWLDKLVGLGALQAPAQPAGVAVVQ